MSVLLPILPAVLASLVAPGRVPQAPPSPAELEREVLENVRNQPLGDGTVADLALPEEFLRRVADRIVRSSYEERYRIIVKDPEAPLLDASASPGRTSWIAIAAAGIALLVVGGVSVARRRGRGVP